MTTTQTIRLLGALAPTAEARAQYNHDSDAWETIVSIDGKPYGAARGVAATFTGPRAAVAAARWSNDFHEEIAA